MTSGAIDALRADRTVLLDLGSGLTDEQWAAPSGCAGWSVQDLVAHMTGLYWMVVDPSQLPDTTGLPTERAQDRIVESQRGRRPAEVLQDYETVSAKALDAAAELEQQDFELPLGDLGTYHASLLPNAYAFDHYTHIRADLFAPRGPLTGPPPSDELRLALALDWIEAAAPQQNAETLAGLQGSVEIAVTGTAARAFSVGTGATVARIECGAHDLVLWTTQRGTWEDLGVRATGDDAALAVVRRLHIF